MSEYKHERLWKLVGDKPVENIWMIVALSALSVACCLGVMLTALRLPGIWLMVASGGLFAWWSQWQRITVTIVLTAVAIGAVAEVVELFMSMFTARKAGASRRASWGGLIGGIVGMLILAVPVPLIGPVIGALLGCFVGATIGELSVKPDFVQGAKVGVFSAMGFALGSAAKVGFALVIAGLLISYALQSPTLPHAMQI